MTQMPNPWRRALMLLLVLVPTFMRVAAAAPNSGALSAIIYGSNRFVAVGPSGALRSSTDGLTWSKEPGVSTNDFVDVIYDGKQFVALATDGSTWKSVNPLHWEAAGQAEEALEAAGIAFGAGTYVMVDFIGQIFGSANNVTWEMTHEPGANSLDEFHDVTFGKGMFIAVGTHSKFLPGQGGRNFRLVAVSRDGRDWIENLTASSNPEDEELWGVSFVNDRFVAVGTKFDASGQAFPLVLSSTDGTNWISESVDGSWQANSVSFGQGVTVVVGAEGRGAFRGSTGWFTCWNGDTFDQVSADLKSVAYGAGRFVAVGNRGIAAVSGDGRAWINPKSSPVDDFATISVGTRPVVGGSAEAGDSGAIWTVTEDGLLANVHFGESLAIRGSCYANGIYLAVGSGLDAEFNSYSALLRSADATAWQPVRVFPGIELSSVTAAAGTFFAVGVEAERFRDVILTSSDGLAWTRRDAGTGSDGFGLKAACHGASRFVAVGAGGAIVTSLNGVSWIPAEVDFTSDLAINDLNDIVFGGGLFVAVGSAGTVATSSDGLIWTLQQVGTNDLSAAVFANGMLYCVGDHGFIAKSRDLLTWVPVKSGTSELLSDVAVAGDTLLVVGKRGTFLSLPIGEPSGVRLSIRQVSGEPSGVQLDFHGPPGSRMLLQENSTPDPATGWVSRQPLELGPGGASTVQLPLAGSQSLYRVVAQ